MSQHKRRQVAARIKRIHGHVHAITKMLDEGRSYSEVVHQISAVVAALDSVVQVVVDDLVEDCMTKLEKKEPFGETLLQLQAVVGKRR